ncbi:MAG: TetR/AcrR family transcriptional regulator [Microbacterium sp.]|uniref:TetR/AcrR family transcriptional regulator n=1 Tax=Microbacterium sp. TaxID=51671 RepID=UPI0039E4C5DB
MNNRGPYAKGRERREEILSVALEVVAERGCRNASNREIARRVGLSQAGLMHYFGSREELYMAVLQARDLRDEARYWNPTPDFRGILGIIENNTRVPGLVQLYVEFSAEASIGKHPAHGYFVERAAAVHEHFALSVRAAQDSGEFGPHIDADEAADLVMAAADGLQQQWLIDPSVDMISRLRHLWTALAADSHLAKS